MQALRVAIRRLPLAVAAEIIRNETSFQLEPVCPGCDSLERQCMCCDHCTAENGGIKTPCRVPLSGPNSGIVSDTGWQVSNLATGTADGDDSGESPDLSAAFDALDATNDCPACEGSGECSNCRGTGSFSAHAKCSECGGTGECQECLAQDPPISPTHDPSAWFEINTRVAGLDPNSGELRYTAPELAGDPSTIIAAFDAAHYRECLEFDGFRLGTAPASRYMLPERCESQLDVAGLYMRRGDNGVIAVAEHRSGEYGFYGPGVIATDYRVSAAHIRKLVELGILTPIARDSWTPAVHMSSAYHRGAWIGRGYCDLETCQDPNHVDAKAFYCTNVHCLNALHYAGLQNAVRQGSAYA